MEAIKVYDVPPLLISLPSLQGLLRAINVERQFSALSLLVVMSAIAIAIIQLQIWTADNPEEPPIICQRIPVIGHLLSLHQHGLDYFYQLRRYV